MASYHCGDLIYRSEPWVHVISRKYFSQYCHSCGKPVASDAKELRTCPKCSLTVYCSFDCKRRGWTNGHEEECVLLNRWSEKNKCKFNATASSSECAETREAYSNGWPYWLPGDYCRIIAKIICKLAKGRSVDDESACVPQPKKLVDFWELLSHWETRKLYEADNALVQRYIVTLDESAPESWTEFRKYLTEDFVGEIYGRVCTNSFAIEEYENFKMFGLAMYLCPAKIDHSCLPNTSYSFNGTTLDMYAIKDVDNFNDLRICYLADVVEPRNLRRTELQRQWKFHCECEACCDGDRETRIHTIWCPNYSCGKTLQIPVDIIVLSNSGISTKNLFEKYVKCVCGENSYLTSSYITTALDCMTDIDSFCRNPEKMIEIGATLFKQINTYLPPCNPMVHEFIITYFSALNKVQLKVPQRISLEICTTLSRSLIDIEDLWTKNYISYSVLIIKSLRVFRRIVFYAKNFDREKISTMFVCENVKLCITAYECIKLHFGNDHKLLTEINEHKKFAQEMVEERSIGI